MNICLKQPIEVTLVILERERHRRRSGWDYGSLPNPISRCLSPARGGVGALGTRPRRAGSSLACRPSPCLAPRLYAAGAAPTPTPRRSLCLCPPPPAVAARSLGEAPAEGQSRSPVVPITQLGFNTHRYTAMKFHPAPGETFILPLMVIYHYTLHFIT